MDTTLTSHSLFLTSSLPPFLSLFPSPSLPIFLSTSATVDKAETLLFSYDVFWEKSDIEWSSRWDAYLLANAPNDKVKHLTVVVTPIVIITIMTMTLIIATIANITIIVVIITINIIDTLTDIDFVVTSILYKILVLFHITPFRIFILSSYNPYITPNIPLGPLV